MRGREREGGMAERERERIREGGNMFVCVCVHTSDAYMLYHCYTKLSGVAVL